MARFHIEQELGIQVLQPAMIERRQHILVYYILVQPFGHGSIKEYIF